MRPTQCRLNAFFVCCQADLRDKTRPDGTAAATDDESSNSDTDSDDEPSIRTLSLRTMLTGNAASSADEAALLTSDIGLSPSNKAAIKDSQQVVRNIQVRALVWSPPL